MQQISELLIYRYRVGIGLKFVKQLLLIQQHALTTCNQQPKMEEISTTYPEYQPKQVLWHPYVRPCSNNHASGTNSLIY